MTRPHSTARVVLSWVAAVLTVGYLIPWAIAITRQKRDHVPTLLVNVFGGWSVIGWVAALVMACRDTPLSYLDTGGR